jgi:sugar phosphate isomerase/epimerase
MKNLFCLLFLTAILFSDANLLLAQSGKKLYTFPIGIQTYTYRKSFPNGVEATLDTIQSLGVKELEAGVPKGMTAEEFKKLVNDRGMTIPSTGAGYEQIVKDPMEVVKNAKALGASYVMVSWIPHDRHDFKFENAKKAVEDFNKVGKVLKENGLTFCYHIHGYEFRPQGNGTMFDYMVENTNPEYVSFELDLLWAQHGGADPVALLNKYGNRFKLVHLKDLKKGVKGDHTGSTPHENDVPLGTGQIDIPGVLKAAKKVGIKHYFIEDESDNIRTSVPQSIAYLKSLKESDVKNP